MEVHLYKIPTNLIYCECKLFFFYCSHYWFNTPTSVCFYCYNSGRNVRFWRYNLSWVSFMMNFFKNALARREMTQSVLFPGSLRLLRLLLVWSVNHHVWKICSINTWNNFLASTFDTVWNKNILKKNVFWALVSDSHILCNKLKKKSKVLWLWKGNFIDFKTKKTKQNAIQVLRYFYWKYYKSMWCSSIVQIGLTLTCSHLHKPKMKWLFFVSFLQHVKECSAANKSISPPCGWKHYFTEPKTPEDVWASAFLFLTAWQEIWWGPV